MARNHTKEELLKRAAPYFSQGARIMYATSDGNYFYESHSHHARNHKSTSKTELFTLTKEEYDALDTIAEQADNTQESEVKKRGRKPSTQE
jgi:hypothetical protein